MQRHGSHSLLHLDSTRVPARRARSGWTLPELLVVTGVLGMLLVFVMLSWMGAARRSRMEVSKENMRSMGQNIRIYYDTWSMFPSERSAPDRPVASKHDAAKPIAAEQEDVSPPSVELQPERAVDDSLWFEPGTGELRRGWWALLSVSVAVAVAVTTIAGFGLTLFKSQ